MTAVERLIVNAVDPDHGAVPAHRDGAEGDVPRGSLARGTKYTRAQLWQRTPRHLSPFAPSSPFSQGRIEGRRQHAALRTCPFDTPPRDGGYSGRTVWPVFSAAFVRSSRVGPVYVRCLAFCIR